MKFDFGRNWISYSQTALDSQKLSQARKDFHTLFVGEVLEGKTFLDVGFGQGLALVFALEAGAKPLGIDTDLDNELALKLTCDFFGLQQRPRTQTASILDDGFVRSHAEAGGFDIVHSWGVLHHTGQMFRAIENTMRLVKPGGLLVISIYNRHWTSPIWRVIKWLYNKAPAMLRSVMVAVFYPVIYLAKWCVTGKSPRQKERGMDFFHDVVDWVGGYPYEYASAEEVRTFVKQRGFLEVRFKPPRVPTGCNEFLFRRSQNEA